MASPVLDLNTGHKIPIIGLGTYASGAGDCTQAIKDAIDAGYRHFDCAYFYGNEAEVGAGLRAKINDGTVKREELFITSKLWNTFHPKEMVVPTCKKSLKNLGLDYMDLYLIHWPFAWKEGENLWPMEGSKMQFSDCDFVETWKGMLECQELGLTKSVGVSNFNEEQIDELIKVSGKTPVVNQIEVHPYLNQKKLIDFCKEKGVIITAYCPLGRPLPDEVTGFSTSCIHDPVIIEIAKKYGKTPAQIVLKYLVDFGITVIPKSVTKSRIVENMQIFDIEIKPEDKKKMDALDRGYRICAFDENKSHKYFPF